MKEGEGEQRERERWGMKGYRDKQDERGGRDTEINKMKERWKGYRDKIKEGEGEQRKRGGGEGEGNWR